MKLLHLKSSVFILSIVLSAKDGFALTATGAFNVSATVTNVCIVDATATTDLAFGSIPGDGSAPTTSNNVGVKCNNGTTYTIALNFGGHSSGGTNRRMINGLSNFLTYQIFEDAGHTIIWGDGTNGQLNPTSGFFTGSGTTQTYPGYGQITAGQSPVAGAYADTITVTVTYT